MFPSVRDFRTESEFLHLKTGSLDLVVSSEQFVLEAGTQDYFWDF